MQIILDCGSGKTCNNDHRAAEALIDAVKAVDTGKHEIVFKFQLFESAPPNVPLSRLVFDEAYIHATELGYKCTASVFDKPSLAFLLNYDVPFVKIACRPDLYWLTGEVPRRIPVYASVKPGTATTDYTKHRPELTLCCVPEYPAKIEDYRKSPHLSDHTIGLSLLDWQPVVWEKHIVLDRDPDNPDAGPFAVTPEDLAGVL